MNGHQTAQNPEYLTQELIEARKMQMGMLPQSAPDISGFQIAAHSSPAVAVGGDFYDFIQLGDDKLGVMIGDAVGHGMAAALLMSMTLADFRSMAPRYASPAEVLNGVNHRLMQIMPTRTSVSSIYAVLDRARNEEGKTELSWGRACQRHEDMDQAKAHLTRAAEIFDELGTTRYLEWTREQLDSI